MQRLVKLLLAGLAGVIVGWLLPGLARADVGEWSSAGPAEAISAVAVDPTHDQHVLAAGASGVWRTSGPAPLGRPQPRRPLPGRLAARRRPAGVTRPAGAGDQGPSRWAGPAHDPGAGLSARHPDRRPPDPEDWRVERANVGSDYRRRFADRVGP
jgi:hypothetical protein